MKILYYNRSLYEQNKFVIVNKNFTNEQFNLFKEANFFTNKSASLIDRTGANEFIVPIKLTEKPKNKLITPVTDKIMIGNISLL
jgi:hypothetical protein